MDAGALFKRAASCDYPPSNTGSLVVRQLAHTRRVVQAHVPLLTKALLGATFVEDAIRTLCQADAQLYFYQSELGVPAAVAGTLIGLATAAGLGGAAALLAPAALGLEAFVTLGPRGGALTLPLVVAVAAGFRTRAAAVALMAVFAASSVAATPFWSVLGDSAYAAYTRDVMRFECVQTLSIMSGLFSLIRAEVNPLSVDGQLRRRKSF